MLFLCNINIKNEMNYYIKSIYFLIFYIIFFIYLLMFFNKL